VGLGAAPCSHAFIWRLADALCLAIPLIFDGRFIAWRLITFMSFAFLVTLVMRWRPRLLSYLAVRHALMDIPAAAMFFGA
jgi:hypothetical protein